MAADGTEAALAPRPDEAGSARSDGWVDSHSHLQEAYLAGARGPGPAPDAETTGDDLLGGALRRAAEAGVRRIVCVGTGVETSADAISLAQRSATGGLGPGAPGLWATVGLHPHDAAEGTAATLELLERSVASGRASGRLVAVGECGLDYHYDRSPRDVQRRAFAEQVAAATRLDLALVIHVREAWGDLFDVLAAEGVPERTVLHCFTGGPEEARRCLDAGMVVSFSGIVTFRSAAEVREAAALCPLDRLLVETDSPFLAPVPHRGRPNEPSLVPLVGAAVAAAKGLGVPEVARASSENAAAVFGM